MIGSKMKDYRLSGESGGSFILNARSSLPGIIFDVLKWRPMGRHFFATCNAEICINTSGVYLLGYWIGYIITHQFVWQCSGNISHFNACQFS